MLAEAIAEVGAAAETTVSSNLCDGALGLVDQQVSGMFETQLLQPLVLLHLVAGEFAGVAKGIQHVQP